MCDMSLAKTPLVICTLFVCWPPMSQHFSTTRAFLSIGGQHRARATHFAGPNMSLHFREVTKEAKKPGTCAVTTTQLPLRDHRYNDRRIKATYDALMDDYVLPHMRAKVFGDRPFKSHFDGRVTYPMASRNVWINETSRTRSMLWHWDRSKPHFIKAILYLSDVTDRDGCFVALHHSRSNATYRLPWRFSPLGGQGSNIPKPWFFELLKNGFEPRCIDGPLGTFITFDPNIIHRGSRPLPGHHRDFLLFLFEAT